MKAGLIVAMASECEALRRAGVDDVVQSGIGKAGAARAATEFILKEHPDCIVNSGCAGGVAPGMQLFDIVVGRQTAYHDVWCGEGSLPGQVQGLPQRFDADPALLEVALGLQTARPLHCGLICSGDQFLTTPEDDARVLGIYPDALACDMESAAVAQVCRHYGVPFLSFRIISDVHSSREAAEAHYRDFWKRVADDSFTFIRQLLERL
ncbi:MAG: 5'-methylthioadenosine/S-adenosylhomocysteine nucleosidase [Bacteroidales bacterium]|jgi:adenosylhomocysteine nucleosidase|nr:5'-methylthioadenosine/S-adenosylhomocysteine nucleosidase [Bacteroidales bacterium]